MCVLARRDQQRMNVKIVMSHKSPDKNMSFNVDLKRRQKRGGQLNKAISLVFFSQFEGYFEFCLLKELITSGRNRVSTSWCMYLRTFTQENQI